MNGWKIESRCESMIPAPVSRTSNANRAWFLVVSASRTRTAISPACVNLMAFPTRLITICRRRSESPQTESGTSALTMYARPSDFAAAVMPSGFIVSFIHSRTLK